MLNQIVIMGRLTREPELRKTESGISVCAFSVAVERDRAAAGQERQTDFIEVVAWRGTAEFVTKWFRKGSMIAVVGQLQSRKWTDKAGNSRTAWEVIASAVHFAGGKREEPAAGQNVEQMMDIVDEDVPF